MTALPRLLCLLALAALSATSDHGQAPVPLLPEGSALLAPVTGPTAGALADGEAASQPARLRLALAPDGGRQVRLSCARAEDFPFLAEMPKMS